MDRVVGVNTGVVYRLSPGNPLGQGAEGRVHLAGGRCVKILHEPLPPEKAAAVSACRRLAARVPGFAWPTELVEDSATKDLVGFAMDVVVGESLEHLMDARATGTIPLLAKVRAACSVARAVSGAHAHRGPRIVLGDVIKAGNLLLDGDAAVFVDAASASLLCFRTPDGGVKDSVSRLTTPGYVAPEVLRNSGAAPSQDGDLFALAVVLFEILFGKSPHEARPCPEAMGLEPDDLVRRGFFPRWTSDPELSAPSYDQVDLPDEVDRMFRAAFLASAMRPAAEAWRDALGRWAEALAPKPPEISAVVERKLPPWTLPLDRAATYVFALWLVIAAASQAYSWIASFFEPVWHRAAGQPVGPQTLRDIFNEAK